MAITETRPETALEAHINPWDAGDEYPSVAAALGSGDHKTIGRFYIGFALLFGLAAWAMQGLSMLDAGGIEVLPDDAVGQVYTLGRFALVLLFAVPLFLGVATYVVPLQVGASTVAFPRAAALAFWTWLLGSVILVVAYAANGGVGGGRLKAVDLSYLALGVIVVALLLGTVCVLTTLVALRTPGMHLDRVPMFSWGVFVAGSIWLLTMPVLLANIALIYVDHRFGRPSEFGVAALQWSQLQWFFQQPQAFAFAIPVLGAVGDIVATTSGERQRHRGLLLAAIGAFGIFSFGAFAQEVFNEDVWEQVLFVGVGLLIVIPVLALLGGWASTLRAGKVRLTTALLGALTAGLTLLVAVVASGLYVIKPLQLHDSVAFQAGLLATVIAAASLGAIAGLHHWAPKITGHLASEGLGKLSVLLGFAGAMLAGLPLCILGFANRFDGINDAADALNVVAALGAASVLGALALTALSLLAATKGPDAGDDPWNGQTLEWATTSPPPNGNFATLAVVRSAEPLLDTEEEQS
jgi:heme/copper-type cytochrome/quinol oxidase subunit 1